MTHHVKDQATRLPSGTWQLDPSGTTVTVTATKLGFIKVPASLAVTSGTIDIGLDGRVGAVEVIADAGSYTSRSAKRNAHVVGDQFLDADRHPEIRVRFDAVAATSNLTDAGYRADGTITVKGQPSPIAVDITEVVFDVDTGTASFTATGSVDRTVLGVGNVPPFVVAREVQLVVTAHARRVTD